MEVKVKASKNEKLLSKDNFAINKPFKKEIKPLKKDFIKILKRYMDNYKPVSVNYVGNPRSLNEKANSKNYLVELKSGNLLLKQIDKKYINKNSIKKLTCQMKWCKNNGILVPKIYNTIKSKSFTSLNNHYWILMEYIEGLYFSGTEEHVRKSAQETAKLIKVLKRLPQKLLPTKQKGIYFSIKEKKIFLKLTSLKNQWDIIFEKPLASKLKKNWLLINEIWLELNDKIYLKKKGNSCIHHDLHPHNFLFKEGKTYILDYDSIVQGHLKSAIGFTILKLFKYMYDNNRNFYLKANSFYKIWMESFTQILPNSFDKTVIINYGKAEVFRRFLSMIDKKIKKIPSSFNGPEIHLDTLIMSEKIFKY